MDDNKKERYKMMLWKKQQELMRTLGQMNENGTGDQSMYSHTELSNYDNHPADMGTELFMTEFNTGLREHEEHLLDNINGALERLENGTFGMCRACGRQIGDERLEAKPDAALCMECEEDREKRLPDEIRRKDRPAEEDAIGSPFGRKYLNKREDDEHEGLDYLNDLMKYGSSDTPQDMGGYHDYEDFYTNETDKQGIVDDMDQVSNDEYKRQLPE